MSTTVPKDSEQQRQALTSEVDCLIVGAGPAGLMLATWLARLGVNTRIIDKRSTKIFTGQADGLQCRTLEVLHSLGVGDRAWKEAHHMIEVSFWNPDDDGKLMRTGRIPETLQGISRFYEVVLHQGRIERFFLDEMKSNGNLEVDRAILPTYLEIDTNKVKDHSAHAVTVHLRHLTEEEATPAQFRPDQADGLYRSNLTADEDDLDATPKISGHAGMDEIVKARYVVGCDGARSWLKRLEHLYRQLGFKLEGDSANYYWGVVDTIPVTDFPDIRNRCLIHSQNSGSVMVIPRERGLVRLYIQLGDLPAGQRLDRTALTPEKIIDTARTIMAPYTLECPEIDWWTCYEIGQRVCENYSAHDRVFLAGDACHTHSPKAGQGMNVSMMDTYNLGWKLGHVIKGLADPSILATYENERLPIARDLIEFDHKFSRLFSGKPARKGDETGGISLEEFKEVMMKGQKFASGTSVDYPASELVGKAGGTVIGDGSLAEKISIGERMPSYKMVNIEDARPWWLDEKTPSDGRWRILIFAGDVGESEQKENLDRLAAFLDSPDGPVRKYTPGHLDVDAVIDILTIISIPRCEIESEVFPDILRPRKGKYGYRDYEKIYSDDDTYHEGRTNIYQNLGIDAKTGCVIVVRPDSYVSLIIKLEDHVSIDKFFSKVLLPSKDGPNAHLAGGHLKQSIPTKSEGRPGSIQSANLKVVEAVAGELAV